MSFFPSCVLGWVVGEMGLTVWYSGRSTRSQRCFALADVLGNAQWPSSDSDGRHSHSRTSGFHELIRSRRELTVHRRLSGLGCADCDCTARHRVVEVVSR